LGLGKRCGSLPQDQPITANKLPKTKVYDPLITPEAKKKKNSTREEEKKQVKN
jgi:hypothetical protein